MENTGSNDMGGAGAAAGNARWNPTKEQIGILEGLYKQGLRTPTAEQIQQITARLRVYGHIEGKNVFYWFQNHKARQRQRERQESLAFLNRCFHRPHGPPPPPLHHFSPCPSVVCRPYYVPQNDEYRPGAASQVVVPCGFKRRQTSDLIDETRENYKNVRQHRQQQHYDIDEHMVHQKTTLQLFPLLPMNNPNKQDQESVVSVDHASSEQKPDHEAHQRNCTSDIEEHKHQPFFDFFTNKTTTCHEY